jgi:cathepsin L
VNSSLNSYTLDQFVLDFGRSYKHGSDEYTKRLSLFQAAKDHIATINARNAKEGRAWVAGIHPFMDWSSAERRALNGYKPSRSHHLTRMTALQTHHLTDHLTTHARVSSHSSKASKGRTRTNATLVDSFDSPDSPAIRNQGNCGSCWAISAVEAVEAQLLKQSGERFSLSAQALVDCVPNPQHCGGTGGCDGATGELAYAFARDHGIPMETDLEYTGETGTCPISGLPKQAVQDGPWPVPQRVVVNGWNQLPSNKAEPLKQALVNEGPVVVAVDGNNWFDYESGIFDGCDKDAYLGHAVLL